MASFIDLTLAETDSDSTVLSIDSESSYHNSMDTVKQEMILEDEGSPLNASINSSPIMQQHCRDTEDGAAYDITSDESESDTEDTYRVYEGEDSDGRATLTEPVNNRYSHVSKQCSK